MNRALVMFALVLVAGPVAADTADAALGVRLKEIARVEGVRENPLTGYGLVVGLAGSGDSPRNQATVQSVANALAAFGVSVSKQELATRNVAAVMVTAVLPPFASPGDRLDVQASSVGDARSLTGGTLLLTPLYGPDEKLYALSQGPLSNGAYRFDSFANTVQKNHPTVGIVPGGATVEREGPNAQRAMTRTIDVLLNAPDFTTAERARAALAGVFPGAEVRAAHAGRISLSFAGPVAFVDAVARIEGTTIAPDQRARVVVNERTGTVVAGGGVRVSAVSVSHGDLRVTVTTDFLVSQPTIIGIGRDAVDADGVRTVIVPDSEVVTAERDPATLTLPAGTTVGDLVGALQKLKLSTRDVITILQAIKAAGALQGDLLVQ